MGGSGCGSGKSSLIEARRRLSLIGIALVVALGLAIPASASARKTWIISAWNGGSEIGIGAFYVHHPHRIGLVMAGGGGGFWLIRETHWHRWGHRQTTAHGKLASAGLYGTPVRIVARRQTFHDCRAPGDTVYFYARVRIHIKGEDHRRTIPRYSLFPQCNNP
jgi:hypothetical protein